MHRSRPTELQFGVLLSNIVHAFNFEINHTNEINENKSNQVQ